MEQFKSKLELCEWLEQYQHPLLTEDWSHAPGWVVVLASGKVKITLPFPNNELVQNLESWIDNQIQTAQVPTFEFQIVTDVASLETTVKSSVTGVKNIIAVSSAKGGVGKSTTAVNLALALVANGGKVGILDADIYGPSVPMMLGTEQEKPDVHDNKWMQPIQAHGLYSNSIGYLVDKQEAAIWRGPMASKALAQLLNETQWPDLDYLVIDMPPGTGDIQLTLAQQIPVTAAVIVTTPQDLALADARKGVAMLDKVEVPVAGVVENMSYHICSQCGHHEAIFGEGGAQKMAQEYGLSLLGQIPLHLSLREDIDSGKPTVAARPDSEHSAQYRQLAGRVAAQVYWHGKAKPQAINIMAID